MTGMIVTAVAAAADHNHPLVLVVEILGPLLRVDDATFEIGDAGKFRRVAAGIVVVSGTTEKKIAGEPNRLAIRSALRLDGP